jgi:hypothetical protein
MVMSAVLTFATRRSILTASVAAVAVGLIFLTGWGQIIPSAEAQNPASPVPAAAPTTQPPAKIIVDPPKPEALERGVVIIQFRTENLQIVPVFGPEAATVSPRIGHLHVTLDDAPWHWAHTSVDPLIVADLFPGPHKILIELADANHKVLAKEVVKFEVPRK